MENKISYVLNSVSNFRLYGFATGAYNCACLTCGSFFLGDKRAIQCLECAIKVAESDKLEKIKFIACIKKYVEEWKNSIPKIQFLWGVDSFLEWLEKNG